MESTVILLVLKKCLLHINELPLRAVFTSLDGPTTGPKSFEGPIGKEVVQVKSLIIQNILFRLILIIFLGCLELQSCQLFPGTG